MSCGAYREAREAYTRLILLRAESPVAYFSRGLAEREMGEIESAQADFERAVQLDPHNADFRWERFKILRLRRELLEETDVGRLEEPVKRNLRSVLSMLMGQDLVNIIRLDEYDVTAKMEYAILLDERGESETALALLDKCVRMSPYDPYVLNERGRLLHRMGRYDDAIRDYAEALRECDSCGFLLFNRALSLKMSGRTGEAVDALQKVIREDSLDGGAWLLLGECRLLRGESREGCLALRKSISLGEPGALERYHELCR